MKSETKANENEINKTVIKFMIINSRIIVNYIRNM